jgi:hypothetical protein
MGLENAAEASARHIDRMIRDFIFHFLLFDKHIVTNRCGFETADKGHALVRRTGIIGFPGG